MRHSWQCPSGLPLRVSERTLEADFVMRERQREHSKTHPHFLLVSFVAEHSRVDLDKNGLANPLSAAQNVQFCRVNWSRSSQGQSSDVPTSQGRRGRIIYARCVSVIIFPDVMAFRLLLQLLTHGREASSS